MGLLPLENAVPLATDFPGPSAWTSIGPQPINVSSSGFFPFNGGPSNSGRVAALAGDSPKSHRGFPWAAGGGGLKNPHGGASLAPPSAPQPFPSARLLSLRPT